MGIHVNENIEGINEIKCLGGYLLGEPRGRCIVDEFDVGEM